MTRIDPLSNVGTSKVFRELCSGPKNPKALSDSLKIKSPPVIEQLRRLQEINIVRLGKKIGRAQNYEIIWENFLELFFERSFKQKFTHVELEKQKIKLLVSNKYFKNFIKNYILDVVSAKDPLTQNPISLLDAMKDFENGLLHSTFFKNKKHFANNPELQDFFDKMRIWHKRARQSMNYSELVFQDLTHRIFSSKNVEKKAKI